MNQLDRIDEEETSKCSENGNDVHEEIKEVNLLLDPLSEVEPAERGSQTSRESGVREKKKWASNGGAEPKQQKQASATTKKKNLARKNSSGAGRVDRLCNPNPKYKKGEAGAETGSASAAGSHKHGNGGTSGTSKEMRKRLADHEANLRSSVERHRPKGKTANNNGNAESENAGGEKPNVRTIRRSVLMQDIGQFGLSNPDTGTRSSKTKASISFGDNPGAGDLAVENDRLKAQLGVLKQKLKVQQDYDQVIEKKNREICQLRQDIQNLKSEHEKEIDRLRDELKESEQARSQLKDDIEELNNKIVNFEEDLYESKVIQLDLLDQLKLVDAELEEA